MSCTAAISSVRPVYIRMYEIKVGIISQRYAPPVTISPAVCCPEKTPRSILGTASYAGFAPRGQRRLGWHGGFAFALAHLSGLPPFVLTKVSAIAMVEWISGAASYTLIASGAWASLTPLLVVAASAKYPVQPALQQLTTAEVLHCTVPYRARCLIHTR